MRICPFLGSCLGSLLLCVPSLLHHRKPARVSRTCIFVGFCGRFSFFQMSRLTFSSRSVVCPSRPASGGDYSPVLEGRDGASRSIITHAAPHHGADVSCTARDSNRLGHCGRVALRGDQEPALVIFREVAARRDPLRLRNHRQTVGIGEKISV